jgi:hypothetical protein
VKAIFAENEHIPKVNKTVLPKKNSSKFEIEMTIWLLETLVLKHFAFFCFLQNFQNLFRAGIELT